MLCHSAANNALEALVESSIIKETGIKTGEDDGNPYYKAELEQVAAPMSVGSLGAAPPGGKSDAKLKKEKAVITGDNDGNPHYKAELDQTGQNGKYILDDYFAVIFRTSHMQGRFESSLLKNVHLFDLHLFGHFEKINKKELKPSDVATLATKCNNNCSEHDFSTIKLIFKAFSQISLLLNHYKKYTQ